VFVAVGDIATSSDQDSVVDYDLPVDAERHLVAYEHSVPNAKLG
jgi:hypothetical protein